MPRPHLLAQLTAGLSGKITLIAAPAGFGKSTLLSEWISEPDATLSSLVPRPTFCWLSLEESDNDPIRFWLYFIAALQSKNPGLSVDTPALLHSPEPPLETILTILLNDLSAWHADGGQSNGGQDDIGQDEAAQAGRPMSAPAIVLVLEDYHLISAPAIHQSLTFLLEHLPPTLHLIMTTRADPPLPLARFRAHGQLVEIRADDLRFTDGEAALFLNDRMGLQLTPDEIELLATRTEGWIVGLQLAALSMHGHEDKAQFLRSFSGSHRYILNYLIEEVLNQQPKAIQEFLLQTSILARLSGPLCDAVMGVGKPEETPATPSHAAQNSRAMLAQLEKANLFLVALDDLGQWYRYHQLFAEVLQYRLRQSQPTLLPLLHHRASLWYAQEGYFADAIHHALLATDFAYAAELIEQVWPAFWNQGAITTLFNWVQALPTDGLAQGVLGGRPSLYVSYAWGLALTGQIEAAEVALHQVEATLQQTDAAGKLTASHLILLGRVAALRALLAARRGEAAVAVPLAKQALTLIPNDALARGDAYYALGLAKQQEGALSEALHAYETAEQLSSQSNDNFLAIAARYHEARILMAQGSLRQAASTYQHLLAAQSRKQLPVVGLAHIGYGEILYQWNDLSSAEREVEAGLALSPRRDLTYTDGPLHRFSIQARIRQAVGDSVGALAAIELAKETAQQTGIALDVARAAALEAFIQLRLGNNLAAGEWAALYAQRWTAVEKFTYRHEFETLVFVRILLAQGDLGTLLPLLAQWVPIVADQHRQGTLLEIYALQLLAFRMDGQREQAMDRLSQILTLAESEGYVRLFVDEGEPMRLALQEWASQQQAPPEKGVSKGKNRQFLYIDQLLAAFTGATIAEETSVRTGATHSQTLIEPLTERENEVLALVTAGLSNAAIAEQLVVSVGTVKTHLKHIYGKLDVQSRTQAVARARALGLL